MLKPWICENKSFAKKYFVRKNQSTQNGILRKSNFILSFIYYIYLVNNCYYY